MPNLPQIPGAKKKGVVVLSCEDDLKKIGDYIINDTVCIDGPSKQALDLALSLHEKYKVGVKVVNRDNLEAVLPADIELINEPIQEIVGEGRVEAVKFKNGKAVGVCLVLFIE